MLESAQVGWWHVVWTTFLAWPPTDERGDWRELANLYARIAGAGGVVTLSEPLPARWQGRPAPTGHVTLPATAVERVTAAVRELAARDRIAGGTGVAALSVAPREVQVVLSCPAVTLRQRVGRLKSRSAALLSFELGRSVGGARTWGRGFWWASLLDEVATGMASAFVSDSSSHGSTSG